MTTADRELIAPFQTLSLFSVQNRAETAASLGERAEQARRHARELWPHPAAEQLLAYAKELEAKAAALVQADGDSTVGPQA